MCEYVSCLVFQLYINAKRPVPYLLAMSYDNVGVVGVSWRVITLLCNYARCLAVQSSWKQVSVQIRPAEVWAVVAPPLSTSPTPIPVATAEAHASGPTARHNRCGLQQQQWLKQFAQGNQSTTTTTGTGQLARQHSFDGALTCSVFQKLRSTKQPAGTASRLISIGTTNETYQQGSGMMINSSNCTAMAGLR